MNAGQFSAAPDARAVTVLPPLAEPSSADEINHRIANSLQLLGAMVSMEARRIVDPVALAAFDRTMRRIAAIGGVQRILYQSPATDHIDLGEYLADLCAELCDSGAEDALGGSVRLSASAIRVSPQDATAVGVVVSELIGNACKYAYPAGMSGDVYVSLQPMPFGGYVLDVRDRGAGMVAGAAPRGSGLGSRVIATMADRLGARAMWSDARPGTRFELYVGKR